MVESSLQLNEALFHVRKPATLSAVNVFYQTTECFECALRKLTTINDDSGSFVVSTKYDIALELRASGDDYEHSCKFDSLSTNSKSHYEINVKQVRANSSLECGLSETYKGECLLCPFALLLCFVVLLTILENALSCLWSKKGSANRKQSQHVIVTGDSLEQQRVTENTHQTIETKDVIVRDDENNNNCNSDIKGNCSSVGDISSVRGDEADDSTAPSTRIISADGQEGDINQIEKNKTTNEQQLQQNAVPANHPQVNPSSEAPRRQPRIEALDAFRGLTIAGMIFVNYGGAGYSMLEHKVWDGLNVADFVFPFFIFSMGASIAISVRVQLKRQRRSFPCIASKVLRRSSILCLLGLFLNSKHNYGSSLNGLRLTGVLQRFGVSYLIVALMYLSELVMLEWLKTQSLCTRSMSRRTVGGLFELLFATNFAALYVYVTFFLEYSDKCPVGYVGPGGATSQGKYANCTGGAAAWLDRTVLGSDHLYQDVEVKQVFGTKVTHDPEGLLGYATSVLLTIIGLQCGKILCGIRSKKQRLMIFAQWIGVLTASCAMIFIVPINKRLWSITFVLATGLGAYLVTLIFYLMFDVYSCAKPLFARLLLSAGKNSIFIYVGHSLLDGMLPWWYPVSDETSHLQLLMRLSWATLVWLFVAHYMNAKNIFVKI